MNTGEDVQQERIAIRKMQKQTTVRYYDTYQNA